MDSSNIQLNADFVDMQNENKVIWNRLKLVFSRTQIGHHFLSNSGIGHFPMYKWIISLNDHQSIDWFIADTYFLFNFSLTISHKFQISFWNCKHFKASLRDRSPNIHFEYFNILIFWNFLKHLKQLQIHSRNGNRNRNGSINLFAMDHHFAIHTLKWYLNGTITVDLVEWRVKHFKF